MKEDDQESIALSNHYLKGSMQGRKAAPNDQEEFMKTLNQMEKEDVPAQVIDEYRKAEILRKSMAVVKKHAQKMEDIRTSPDRYDKVKGKVNQVNPFAINLSSVADTKRTMVNITKRDEDGYIKEEKSERLTGRGKSGRGAPGGANPADSDDWYKPELGDIPYAPLTKEKRMKIEARDLEISAKQTELEEILVNINARKRERAEKEAKVNA